MMARVEQSIEVNVSPGTTWDALTRFEQYPRFMQGVEEVRITVVHEIAHHFGIDDARLEELGYE